MSKEAELSFEGNTVSLPVVEGSEGELGIDISKLRGQTGMVTLDNGFGNTASCSSAITFLDGEKGILRYRGYSIEELSEKASFGEVAYLLIHGELPNKSELDSFEAKLQENSNLPEGIYKIIDQFPKTTHPMGLTSAVMAALPSFYPDLVRKTDLTPDEELDLIAQIMGQIKATLAYFYRTSQGLEANSSTKGMGFAEDFLSMMFATPSKPVSEAVSNAFDVLLTLHADHEQNCSASAVRVVGSSKVNLYAAVSAGVDALWGQLHGGANQAVLEMLEMIQNDGGDYAKYIEKAKDKNDPFRLMGFGHRVYKNFDPRARIIKKACDAVLSELGVKDPLLDIAKGLEEVALQDSYFVDRKLYPNVDFYSGIIYRALGIPTDMFTCMFVLGRAPGWMAQWREMRHDSTFRIARPRQIYTGANSRDFVSIENR